MISAHVKERFVKEEFLARVKFNADGLVPAVVQDGRSGAVLMMGWMSEESLKLTIESGRTWFWSRSRRELWAKGATSGDVQTVQDLAVDCDGDTLLVVVEQTGRGACHTGNYSCFFSGIALQDGGEIGVE